MLAHTKGPAHDPVSRGFRAEYKVSTERYSVVWFIVWTPQQHAIESFTFYVLFKKKKKKKTLKNKQKETMDKQDLMLL